MFRVGRDVDVGADVHARSGAFLERDDRQAIEEVVEDLLGLLAGLLGNAPLRISADGSRMLALFPICARAAQAADRGRCCEGLEVAMVDLAR